VMAAVTLTITCLTMKRTRWRSSWPAWVPLCVELLAPVVEFPLEGVVLGLVRGGELMQHGA
jgi:hypothetical protein